jgi:hypothetical protein
MEGHLQTLSAVWLRAMVRDIDIMARQRQAAGDTIRYPYHTSNFIEISVNILIVVFPCISTSIKILSFQQMHNLLKHKMLQFSFKSFSYTAPTCFGPHGPSSGSTYQNLTKVTISLKYQLKHFVKIVVLWQLGVSVCSVCGGAHTLQTEM